MYAKGIKMLCKANQGIQMHFMNELFEEKHAPDIPFLIGITIAVRRHERADTILDEKIMVK